MEDGDGTEDEGEVDHLLAGVREGLVVGGRDGDVAGTKVVVGDVGVGSGVVDAEELLLAGGRADGTVREADGFLGAIHELVHQHPETLGGVGGSGTMDVQNLTGGGDSAATDDGGKSGGKQVLHGFDLDQEIMHLHIAISAVLHHCFERVMSHRAFRSRHSFTCHFIIK